MNQALRNKIYGVAIGVLSVFVVLGVVDQSTSDEAASFITLALDQSEALIGLGIAITAFIKSLPSRVNVVELKGKHSEA